MTKSERREVQRIQAALQYGLIDKATAARALSALQRSAMTAKSAREIADEAVRAGVSDDPEYIV